MPKSSSHKKQNKDFVGQFDDEEVLHLFRKHPIVMRKGLIISMLAILAGTIPALIKPEMSYFYGGLAGGLVLGIILFIPSWIIYWYSVFIVTNRRLIQITQKGFFNRSVVDIGLNNILATSYEVKGIQATLLGFGTIMIQTYMGDLIINDVYHPAEEVRCIAEVLRSEGIVAEQVEPGDIKQDKEYNEEDFEEV